jgi:hypothetical protein
MVVRRVGVLSCGKVVGTIYACVGVIVGAIFSLMSITGVGAAALSGDGKSALLAGFFGLAAIIVLPLLYGFLGFLCGVIAAWAFNVSAGFTGGLELEVEL